MDCVPDPFATWSHGPQDDLIRLHQIRHLAKPWHVKHLVATQRQADYLLSNGIKGAKAVGMPIIYAGNVGVDRIANSLLVMPAHVTRNTIHSWDERKYVAEIIKLKDQFSVIVVCISDNCVRAGKWTNAFAEYGIPWITGAAVDDGNSLNRLAILLKSFEFVTTNTMGSCLAYAAYFGCKLSIYGPYAERPVNEYKSEPFYVQFPELLPIRAKMIQEQTIRAQHSEFFVSPEVSKQHLQWGRDSVGIDFRQPPSQIAKLLGWTPLRQIAGKLRRRFHREKS